MRRRTGPKRWLECGFELPEDKTHLTWNVWDWDYTRDSRVHDPTTRPLREFAEKGGRLEREKIARSIRSKLIHWKYV
jgi:hypothetical protein